MPFWILGRLSIVCWINNNRKTMEGIHSWFWFVLIFGDDTNPLPFWASVVSWETAIIRLVNFLFWSCGGRLCLYWVKKPFIFSLTRPICLQWRYCSIVQKIPQFFSFFTELGRLLIVCRFLNSLTLDFSHQFSLKAGQ